MVTDYMFHYNFILQKSRSCSPLIALQYHEVELAIEFEEAANLSGVTAINNASVWVDYISLIKQNVFRKLAQEESHEIILVETVQHI